ncbi:MAG: 23S rRNA (guanosine(2251)-2'-O)-methyltransferase RlmB [Flavobacteriaceae bacterium]|nr:23S rRNA (guanosine(2251)-2'-O)-methyltransferase RlmB [Flavobacteriaceae bacterium]
MSTIFGIRAILEAIEAGKQIQKIYLDQGLNAPLIKKLEYTAQQAGIKISYVPEQKIAHKAKHKNHQGAIAEISAVEFKDLSALEKKLSVSNDGIFLLLDGITDVRNLGAIIRTAECVGALGIIMAKSGNAPINADAIKTSAGAAFHIDLFRVDHLKDAIFLMQQSELRLYAATEKSHQTVYETIFEQRAGIIMGSEDKGIHPAILKLCDERIKLPIYGKTESLNVSVACGAVLYEVVRQRLLEKTGD